MIGAVVLSTEQGLGYLAKDFYGNGVIDKVLIRPHGSRTNHYDWFSNGKVLDKANYEWFFEDLDAIVYFEEPFDWTLIPEARKRGIKNVFVPMYECTRYPFPYEPDVVVCTSDLDLKFYEGKNTVRLNVPVNVKWKQRTRAKVFVHNAGNGGLGGRNGTKELLEAMQYVKSPIELKIRAQSGQYTSDDHRVSFEFGTIPKEELFSDGDVFIFPEKFNGLSLPLQEAFASGMLVMCGNRFPMNTWLPTEPMIPIDNYKKERIAVEFDSAIYDPKKIAETIDYWYNKDITDFSLVGKAWAHQNSWSELKDKYKKLCEK